MDECAGVLRMDPAPFTLRSLLRMVEANQKAAWNHTSHILWIIAEVNRNGKERRQAFDPREFNPMHKGSIQRGTPITKDSLRSKAAAWRLAQAKKQEQAKE